jgi:hypothetical protein
MMDDKYLDLYMIIVIVRVTKAMKEGLYGTDEWLHIVQDSGWKD